MRAQLAVAEAIALVLACVYGRAAMTALANLSARIGVLGVRHLKRGEYIVSRGLSIERMPDFFPRNPIELSGNRHC